MDIQQPYYLFASQEECRDIFQPFGSSSFTFFFCLLASQEEHISIVQPFRSSFFIVNCISASRGFRNLIHLEGIPLSIKLFCSLYLSFIWKFFFNFLFPVILFSSQKERRIIFQPLGSSSFIVFFDSWANQEDRVIIFQSFGSSSFTI